MNNRHVFFLMLLLSACNYRPTQEKGQSKKNLSDSLESAAGKTTRETIMYTCPMHPQVQQDHAGSCPICGMTLVKKIGPANSIPANKTQASPNGELNTVLKPINSTALSDVNAIKAKLQSASLLISADGYLAFDTRTYRTIAARYAGRIEKVYIHSAFQEIRRGERVVDIYSPDLITAQQDLLFLLKHSPNDSALIHASKQKLLLLGITKAQVSQMQHTNKPFYSMPVYSPYDGHVHDMPHRQMGDASSEKTPEESFISNQVLSIKEGMYVAKGQALFTVVDPDKLWALINIPSSSISVLRLHQLVKLTLPDLAGVVLYGKVDFIVPTLVDGDKTTQIRVYLANKGHLLKANSLVKAEIQADAVKGLWVPRSALVDMGSRQVVWIKQGGAYYARQVSTGMRQGDEILITKGISAADSLASNGQYLCDFDGFIKLQDNE